MFGKKFKIEELFEDEKLCKRTVEGKEFYLASKVVNIPEVGRVKIVKCLMEDKKKNNTTWFQRTGRKKQRT